MFALADGMTVPTRTAISIFMLFFIVFNILFFVWGLVIKPHKERLVLLAYLQYLGGLSRYVAISSWSMPQRIGTTQMLVPETIEWLRKNGYVHVTFHNTICYIIKITEEGKHFLERNAEKIHRYQLDFETCTLYKLRTTK
jgi:hypothetical protein